MTEVDRRTFTKTVLASAAAACVAVSTSAEEKVVKPTMGLGFSLYGMRSLKIPDALKTCRDIGYDCVELTCTADWPADPARLPQSGRDEIRDVLAGTGLRLTSLMENLHAVVDDEKHKSNLARLAAAAQLGHELSPKKPPLIETVLGGRPDQWDATRNKIVDRLGDWAKVAAETKTIITIKAHVGGAMHLPEHPVWVTEQLASPWIRCAYDYSHFDLQGVDMAQSVKTLVPHSNFVHVKDGRGDASKFEFLLPGEGKTDYAHMLRLIVDAGYQGDIIVEVSGQIHSRPDYNPLDAAQRCYKSLAPAFEKADIRRA